MRRAAGSMAATVLVVALALPSSVAAQTAEATDEAVEPAEISGETTDRRPELLAHLGSPDAWVVSADEVDGELVRFESWMYHEAATQVDLVDGEILWSVHLDPLPDGALYPLAYSPDQFELLSSAGEVRESFPNLPLKKVELNDKHIPDAVFLVGEQLLLGFVDDQLVYVEAMVLAPEKQ